MSTLTCPVIVSPSEAPCAGRFVGDGGRGAAKGAVLGRSPTPARLLAGARGELPDEQSDTVTPGCLSGRGRAPPRGPGPVVYDRFLLFYPPAF